MNTILIIFWSNIDENVDDFSHLRRYLKVLLIYTLYISNEDTI